MRVGTKDHLTAACEHLAGKLVNDRLMRRNVYSAVFLGTGQAKHVVIFIYGTADRTQGVVAVGQHIRHGELLKAGSTRCLYDPHKGDIMGRKLVEPYLKLVHVV